MTRNLKFGTKTAQIIHQNTPCDTDILSAHYNLTWQDKKATLANNGETLIVHAQIMYQK